MSRTIKKGSADQSIYVEILDSASTTGGRKTGIVYNAAGVRTAIGLASANLDSQLSGIDTNIGVAGAGLSAIPWNASWDAEVQSECTDALNAYDPPTKAELDSAVAPLATAANLATIAGYLDTEIVAIKSVTDKLDDTLEDDAGTYRFTTNALEQAPSGTGASAASIVAAMFDTDSGETEATAVPGSVVYEIVQNVAAGSGLDAAGVRAAIGLASANLDTQLSNIHTKTTNLPSDPADQSLIIAATDAVMTRLGAPVGASLSNDIASVKAQTAAIETDTQDIQGRIPAALVDGRMDANVGALSGDSTAADNAEAFFDGTGYAGVNNVIPTVTTITNGVTLASTGHAAFTESYAADGAAFTLPQALYQMWSFMSEKNNSGTTLTTKKLDGATTAMTFTYDATTPTTITRST